MQMLSNLLIVCTLLGAAEDKYQQYIDKASGVVMKPDKDGFDDPYGDGVWRSSWFYGSLLIIKNKDAGTYNQIVQEHHLDMADLDKFLVYFRDNCTTGDQFTLPKNPSQKFSGDQLAPLLYLLASVNQYGEESSKAAAKTILERLSALVKKKGALSDARKGQILPNQEYLIDLVCKMYGFEHSNGLTRGLQKTAFSAACKAHNIIAQAPDDRIATLDDYAVFNALSLVTVTAMKWGKDDSDVNSWRENYRLHADKGWGPAFRIVSGRSIDDATIDSYKTMYIKRDLDNDIVLSQRPHKFLNNTFPTSLNSGPGIYRVLDYVILKALQSEWK